MASEPMSSDGGVVADDLHHKIVRDQYYCTWDAFAEMWMVDHAYRFKLTDSPKSVKMAGFLYLRDVARLVKADKLPTYTYAAIDRTRKTKKDGMPMCKWCTTLCRAASMICTIKAHSIQ